MGNRHWPYDPHAPPGADADGWVIAGEEQDDRIPPAGYPQPEYGPAGYDQPGYGSSGYDRPGYDRPGYEDPRYERPGYETSGYETSGYETSGYESPGYPQAGYEEPGYGGTRYGSAYEYPPRSYPPERYSPPGARRAARASAGGHRSAVPPPEPIGEPVAESSASLAAAASWVMSAFLVPILLYFGWAFTRSGVAEAGCVDAAGQPCSSPRVEAIENLLGVLPAIGGALVLAMLIAVGLRQVAATWRPASIGLASAVIGAGIATVVSAAL